MSGTGTPTLTYDARAVEDLHSWLGERGDWVELTHDARNNKVRDL